MKEVCVCLLLHTHSLNHRTIWDCLCNEIPVPDLFGLTSVIQREEDVCILADAVISEALQIDEEVV